MALEIAYAREYLSIDNKGVTLINLGQIKGNQKRAPDSSLSNTRKDQKDTSMRMITVHIVKPSKVVNLGATILSYLTIFMSISDILMFSPTILKPQNHIGLLLTIFYL